MPALRPVTDGRGQPCPQCESESQYRVIRVMSFLCGIRVELARCMLAGVQGSLGACRAGSELEERLLVCLQCGLSMSCVAGVFREC